jgi:flavin-dependent dehydrogenase
MTAAATEVCVLGAGPAGAVTAIELARLGLRVCLLRGDAPSGVRPETASGLFAQTLARAGLQTAVDQAVLSPVFRERIRRDGHEIVHDPAGSSLVVDRTRLDEALIDAAGQHGVTVIRARGVAQRQPDGAWRISRSDGSQVCSAGLLIEARGRRGLGADSVAYGRGKTVAFYGRFRGIELAPYETIVGQEDAFWYWLIGLPDQDVRIITFVSAAARRDARPAEWIQAARDSAGLTGRGAAELSGARDATPRHAADPGSDRLLRVGEAFLTVDPLSSSGLYVAAVSAVQASRVANTIIRRPDDAALARSFYASAQADMTRSFEQDGALQDGAVAPQHASPPPPPRAALSELALAPGFQLSEAPVLTGDFIERHPVIARQGARGLAVVDGWPVERFIAPLMQGRSVVEALRSWPELGGATRLKMIEILLAEGVLVPRGAPGPLRGAGAADRPVLQPADGGWR